MLDNFFKKHKKSTESANKPEKPKSVEELILQLNALYKEIKAQKQFDLKLLKKLAEILLTAESLGVRNVIFAEPEIEVIDDNWDQTNAKRMQFIGENMNAVTAVEKIKSLYLSGKTGHSSIKSQIEFLLDSGDPATSNYTKKMHLQILHSFDVILNIKRRGASYDTKTDFSPNRSNEFPSLMTKQEALDFFGLRPYATKEEISKRRVQLLRENHPDTRTAKESDPYFDFSEYSKKVNVAYKLLTSQNKI